MTPIVADISFVRKPKNALPIAKARIAMLGGRKLDARDHRLYLQALNYVEIVEKQGSTKASEDKHEATRSVTPAMRPARSDVRKADHGDDGKGPKVLCAASRLALILLVRFSPPFLTLLPHSCLHRRMSMMRASGVCLHCWSVMQ
jgi:hypothetical protein